MGIEIEYPLGYTNSGMLYFVTPAQGSRDKYRRLERQTGRLGASIVCGGMRSKNTKRSALKSTLPGRDTMRDREEPPVSADQTTEFTTTYRYSTDIYAAYRPFAVPPMPHGRPSRLGISQE